MPTKKGAARKLPLLSLFLLIGLLSCFNTFAADTAAPVTVATKTPAIPNGKFLWYVTPVTVTLNATDLDSGVKDINYKIDSMAWQKVDFTNSLNLAPNPSFEFSDENLPINTEGWVVGTIDEFASYARDTSEYKPGFESTSIKIASTGESWHSINHADTFAVATPYSNMNAYAWIKTSSVSGTAFFTVYAISQDVFGIRTVTPIAASTTLTGTNDWTQLSINFVVSVPNAIGVYLEIGISGAGTIWTDAVSISNSLNPSTSFTVSSDSELHTVQYYATDRTGNIETTKSITFKIDQTPPGNWRDAGAVRGIFGQDYQVYVWINVDDPTSGLSVFTDKFQYTTLTHVGFGVYSTLWSCGSTWRPGEWSKWAITPPFSPGAHSAYIITPKIDFCDNNWRDCKYIRFYSEDMAGNVATKDMCINGPWIKLRGKGVARSNTDIDMIAEAADDNTDGLIETGGASTSFFTSSTNWNVPNSKSPTDYGYDKLSSLITDSKTQISTSGNLVASSGVYKIDGDYEITSGKIPGSYGTATFNQIVFVNGKLRITNNIQVANGSTALFIVKGGVEIAKAVTVVRIGIISDSTLNTAYDITEGEGVPALTMRGTFTANKFMFQRTLLGTQNEWNPSEDITYEPKYAIKLTDYIGTNAIRWISSD
jgi:hypothetical protein